MRMALLADEHDSRIVQRSISCEMVIIMYNLADVNGIISYYRMFLECFLEKANYFHWNFKIRR
ncbi:hypothetical protein PAECIP111893_04827 [Paenibacillus plantiphilus]|uniref:Uncharacterized protein n=1 Tax=Paenibacillus plantiphilus TaxID=2905650 RepID=A0ABM9CSL2_9BACL|nr:hypothetical protein PAECIP111893_04827 [Paenibacillus plantiphilus]